MMVGRWLEKFESEATDAGLPTDGSAKTVVERFATGSGMALWVASVFGAGIRFTASWTDFRSAFLK